MIKGLLFDLNGTLIDIYTSESDENIYRTLSNFFDYYGIKIPPSILKEEYFTILRRQKNESSEEFPEFDVVKLFAEIIRKYGSHVKNPPSPECAATIFRAAGRYKLELYDGVVCTLEKISKSYRIGAISDGQKIWAESEFKSVGLEKFFHFSVISSVHGYRKPDQRMFAMALEKMHLHPHEVIFVGNDMFRDIFGAHAAGMKTVFFRSNQGEQKFSGAEPDYIIYNFPQLLDAVRFFEKTINEDL